MKKILIIIIIFINSCGYQSIYNNKNKDPLEFSKISLIGDKDINRKILSSLNISEISEKILKKELMLESIYKVDETSKNSKGQIASYRSQIVVSIKILDQKKITSEKIFSQSFSYANLDNKFELVEYQSEIKNNITEKIIEEIVMYMNLK